MNGRAWSSAEDQLLREQYPSVSTRVIAAGLGRHFVTVYQHAAKLGLKKTDEYMKSPAACRLRRGDNVGAAFRFPKGHIPANAGTRRPGWAPGRMRETQFRKGQTPRNTLPMWSFRFVDGYLMLKTGAPTPKPTTGWEYVHKLIWEQAKGPLPDWRSARLWWKDGDHANCSLSNLELVKGSDHVARTTIQNLPPELRQVIQLTGALKRKIRNREGKVNGKEHASGLTGSPVRNARVAV
jgi:hypothetical protein